MRSLLLFIPVLILTMVINGSCSQSTEEVANQDADRLFSESCKLTELYIDSMMKAQDSTDVIGLMERFDTRLTKLNFSVLPETDYHLSEGRNDTISALIDSLRKVYDRKLYSYAHPSTLNDSVATRDTIDIQ